jgi:hypothetical protein
VSLQALIDAANISEGIDLEECREAAKRIDEGVGGRRKRSPQLFGQPRRCLAALSDLPPSVFNAVELTADNFRGKCIICA